MIGASGATDNPVNNILWQVRQQQQQLHKQLQSHTSSGKTTAVSKTESASVSMNSRPFLSLVTKHDATGGISSVGAASRSAGASGWTQATSVAATNMDHFQVPSTQLYLMPMPHVLQPSTAGNLAGFSGQFSSISQQQQQQQQFQNSFLSSNHNVINSSVSSSSTNWNPMAASSGLMDLTAAATGISTFNHSIADLTDNSNITFDMSDFEPRPLPP
jgi:hypothetical protein